MGGRKGEETVIDKERLRTYQPNDVRTLLDPVLTYQL